MAAVSRSDPSDESDATSELCGYLCLCLRFKHSPHLPLPSIKFATAPADAPVPPADVHAIDAVLLALAFAHAPMRGEAPVRREGVGLSASASVSDVSIS